MQMLNFHKLKKMYTSISLSQVKTTEKKSDTSYHFSSAAYKRLNTTIIDLNSHEYLQKTFYVLSAC